MTDSNYFFPRNERLEKVEWVPQEIFKIEFYSASDLFEIFSIFSYKISVRLSISFKTLASQSN